MVASMEQIDAKITEISKTYGENGENAQQLVDYYNEDVTRKSSIELVIIEKMAQDAILEKAKIKVIKKKFTDITGQG
jgi:trigger factor